eukprot:3818412-Pyramimonas_sp.AAC.1
MGGRVESGRARSECDKHYTFCGAGENACIQTLAHTRCVPRAGRRARWHTAIDVDDPFFEVHHSGSWMDVNLGTTTLSTRKDTVNVETIASVNAVVVHRATEARSGPPASASVSSLVSSRVRKNHASR